MAKVLTTASISSGLDSKQCARHSMVPALNGLIT